MKILLFYILFLAFGGQQTITSTLTSTLTSVAEPVEAPGDVDVPSTSSGTCTNTLNVSTYIICNKDVCDTSLRSDSVTYYKSQLLIADSLYKNYLPQYNFDEVKAAVTFFERTSGLLDFWTSGTQELRTSGHQGPRNPEIQNSGDPELQNSGDPEFLSACAKAHYYHAVGLTERDDVVGACEHYLRALEIMEEYWNSGIQDFRTSGSQKSRDPEIQNPEIRFLALIYNRLGRLFYNENYCELAITKYMKALKYVEVIGEKSFKANVLKELGNSYQLANRPDSALYYYNESLKYNSSLPNKLDVEKSIAQILFYKGDKDTAYSLIRNNLNMIDNENVRYSYYATLGKMYQEDEVYDSAIYYLEKSIESTIYYTRVTSAMQLSAIFDSLGNYEKQAYYDIFVSKMSVVNFNKGVENTQLHTLYIDYCNKKTERERLKSRNNNIIIILSVILLIFMLIVFIFAIFQNRHNKISSILKDKELLIAQIDNEIKIKEKHISDLEFKQKLNDGKIRKKNNEIKEKDELLIKYRRELTELKNKLERLLSECSDLNKFLQSEICSSILNNIDDLNKKNIDSSELGKLKQEQFILLLRSANIYLNNLIDDISNQYQKLKNDDLYYLCLIILGLNDKQISSLFGVTYNTIKIRKRKICSILGINNDDLYSFLMGKI
ncbi:MAG: tetratricopeptide repeat protein [Bacteroidales bacterium]|nr:tetratricopeptide repeat protein [Bacteroidales bacterium]